MNKLSLTNLIKQNLTLNKRVLMRVDFNVPMKSGVIADTRRIDESLHSLNSLVESGASRVILVSHMGRPNGKLNNEFTLAPVYEYLKSLYDIDFHQGLITDEVLNNVNKSNKKVVLLDNVRFHAEEEGSYKDDSGKKVKVDKESITKFRGLLNAFGDVYVNDAFGCSHRAHSSIVGSQHAYRASGHLLSKEIEYFSKVISSPERPVAAIVGGSKVADKLLLLENLLGKVNKLFIGGAMANSFVANVYDKDMGASKLENDDGSKKICQQVVNKAKELGVDLYLPTDFTTTTDIESGAAVVKTQLASNDMAMDIGPDSYTRWTEELKNCKTIVWNGPVGMFEKEQYASGTRELMYNALSHGTSIICGGDTGNAVKKFGANDLVSHVSTGGGASLELLEGKELPGISNLTDN